MNIYPFLSTSRTCDDALQWVKVRLIQADLHPVQTFDLQTARAGLHDCPCPRHGTDECGCQLVVLLVYNNTDTPETLILHGNETETWLSLTGTPDSNTTGSLAKVIEDTLIGE